MSENVMPLPLQLLKQALEKAAEPTAEDIEQARQRMLAASDIARRLDERWPAVCATAERIGPPDTPRLLERAVVHWVDATHEHVQVYLHHPQQACARQINHPAQRKAIAMAMAAHFGLQWEIRCETTGRKASDDLVESMIEQHQLELLAVARYAVTFTHQGHADPVADAIKAVSPDFPLGSLDAHDRG